MSAQATEPHAPARLRGASAQRGHSPLRAILLAAWVLAACFTLAFAAWNWFDGPSHAKSGGAAGGAAMEVHTQEFHDPGAARSYYWDDLDRQRLVSFEERQRWRDTVLLCAVFMCVVMSVVVIIVVARRA